MAYHNISAAQYCGPQRNFTLNNYIAKYANIHAELLDLKKVTYISKKVQYFLCGILEPRLKLTKGTVLSNRTKNEDFNIVQQYFSTVVANLVDQNKSDRLVLSTRRGKDFDFIVGYSKGIRGAGRGHGGGGGGGGGWGMWQDESQR